MHSYKAHIGADAETTLVEAVSVAPGNVNEGRAGPGALPEMVGDCFADRAYRGQHFAPAVRARRGTPRIVATHVWVREGDDAEGLLRSIIGADQSGAGAHREDIRDLQAFAQGSPRALAWLGQGWPAGASEGHRLQSATNDDDTAGKMHLIGVRLAQ